MPTGAGKTAAIDVAVFHLALEADRGADRRAPTRIFFVVDRRLVVDDAERRAKQIAGKLANARDGVVRAVAERLATLAEDAATPLVVAKLRGGMPKDPDWIRTPAQPAVVLSTVDQVGSRLLFRGYGISDRMKPVHAALVGTDALVITDEAHLSSPFVETLRDVLAFQLEPRWSENRVHAPFEKVTLSATPADASVPIALISAADFEDPSLGPRLVRSKLAALVPVG